MKKLVFIPTRDTYLHDSILSFFREAEWEVIPMCGYSSIFEAFSEGLKSREVGPDDLVILCHDDIEILTAPKHFNFFIENSLKDRKAGFLGVAGTKMLKSSGVWWEDLNKQLNYMNPLSGAVHHGKKESMSLTYYGAHGNVAVLDGLFLCARGSLLNSINIKKPAEFNGGWDFYDIYYTTQATLKGYTNKTIPIQIVHESFGELAGRDSWYNNKKAYTLMFKDKLPLIV